MANKILIVAKREYLERVRSRWFVISTLAVPLLFAAVGAITVLLVARGAASSSVKHIAIIDATGAGLGERVARSLVGDTTLTAAVDTVRPRVVNVTREQLAATESTTTAEVRLPKHIAGYLVLDDSTLRGRSARYAGRNASSITDMARLESVLRQEVMVMRLQREGVRADIVGDLARNRLQLESERLEEGGRSGSGAAGIGVGLGIGVLMFMSILIHGQAVMRGVLEEKMTRVSEVVISSIKPESLLAGKVLGVGGVGLTQQASWIGLTLFLGYFFIPIVAKATGGGATAAAAAASASGGANPVTAVLAGVTPMLLIAALLYFIIGFAFYASLYAAAGAMVNSEQEAQQAAAPVLVLAMSTYLMINPVMVAPNGTVATVLSWLPWSSPIIMPMRMGMTSVSMVSVIGSLLVAAAGTVGAVWLSARIYRIGMLMYGKKPSFKEVARWIRYA